MHRNDYFTIEMGKFYLYKKIGTFVVSTRDEYVRLFSFLSFIVRKWPISFVYFPIVQKMIVFSKKISEKAFVQ